MAHKDDFLNSIIKSLHLSASEQYTMVRNLLRLIKKGVKSSFPQLTKGWYNAPSPGLSPGI
jgi:hypothetical protein